MGRAGRDVHAPLQHRAHRRDARRVPGRPSRSTAASRSARSSSACSRRTFYLAELVLCPIFGILSDRQGHHRVMLYGPAFGAVAVILTGLTTNLFLLGGTRWLEGASTAASVPSILGYIAMVTAGNELPARQGVRPLRGRDPARPGRRLRGRPAPVRRLRARSRSSSTRSLYGGSFLIFWTVKDPAGEARTRSRPRTSGSRATSSCCAAPTSGCWPRPGSRSTRRSGCGSASRSSSSPRPTRASRTRS